MASNALVISSMEINENGPIYIDIKGRKPGLLNWFLTLIGINTKVSIEVHEKFVRMSSASFSGRINQTIPLSAISNVLTGLMKPVLWLILALVALVAGIVVAMEASHAWPFIIGLIVAICFVIAYILGKSTILCLRAHSGDTIGMLVKRSLIEGIAFTDEDADRIVTIVSDLIERAQTGSTRQISSEPRA